MMEAATAPAQGKQSSALLLLRPWPSPVAVGHVRPAPTSHRPSTTARPRAATRRPLRTRRALVALPPPPEQQDAGAPGERCSWRKRNQAFQRHHAAVRRVRAANRSAADEAWGCLSASLPPAGSSAVLSAGRASGVAAAPILPAWARRIPVGHTPFLVGGAIACDRCGATRTMDTRRGLLFQQCRGTAPAGTWDRIVGMKRGRPPSQAPCWPDGLGPGPRAWHRLTWQAGQWEVGAALPSPAGGGQAAGRPVASAAADAFRRGPACPGEGLPPGSMPAAGPPAGLVPVHAKVVAEPTGPPAGQPAPASAQEGADPGHLLRSARRRVGAAGEARAASAPAAASGSAPPPGAASAAERMAALRERVRDKQSAG